MTIVNGRSIGHYKRLDVLETALEPSQVQPASLRAISNGYRPDDFVVDDRLRLYLPLHTIKGSSLVSVDRYRQACTVTGAVWRPSGRYFDGVDDVIECGTPTFTALGQGTVEFWAKPTAEAQMYVVSYSKKATGSVDEMSFIVDTRGGVQRAYLFIVDNTVNTISMLSDVGTTLVNTWYHIVVTSDGSAYGLYIDGSSVNKNFNAGADNGTWFDSLTTDADQLTIGALARSNGYVGDTTGNVGEVRAYDEALTAAEVAHNYAATRWRYK